MTFHRLQQRTHVEIVFVPRFDNVHRRTIVQHRICDVESHQQMTTKVVRIRLNFIRHRTPIRSRWRCFSLKLQKVFFFQFSKIRRTKIFKYSSIFPKHRRIFRLIHRVRPRRSTKTRKKKRRLKIRRMKLMNRIIHFRRSILIRMSRKTSSNSITHLPHRHLFLNLPSFIPIRFQLRSS